MKCQFCERELANLKSLQHHQRNSKFCLSRQNICECKSKFVSLTELCEHQLSCIPYIKEKIIREFEFKSKEQEKQITELKQKNAELENTIKEIAMKPKKIVNNIIQNLNIVDISSFKNHANNFTLEHVLDDIDGYVRYSLEHPLKDSIVCTDFSRRKIKYLDEKGNLTTDINMSKLSQPLFESIHSINTQIISDYISDLVQKQGNDVKIPDYLGNLITFVREASKGNRTENLDRFIKEICTHTAI